MEHIFEAAVKQTASSVKRYESVTKSKMPSRSSLAVANHFIPSHKLRWIRTLCAFIAMDLKAWLLIVMPKQKHPEDSADVFTQPVNLNSVGL